VAPGSFWTGAENLAAPGFDLGTLQPVAGPETFYGCKYKAEPDICKQKWSVQLLVIKCFQMFLYSNL